MKTAGGLVLPGNRADLGRQVALKFGVDVDDEAIVRGEVALARLCLSKREVAIGSIFQPHIKSLPRRSLPPTMRRFSSSLAASAASA